MNKSRTIRTFTAAGLAVGLVLGLSGCGKAAEKLSEKAMEKTIEKSIGGDANVDLDTGDGTFKVETDEGTFEMGGGDIPADWPSDVPLPNGFKPLGNMNTSSADGTNITLTGSVDMSVAEATAFYEDSLSGWESSGKTSMSNDGVEQRSLMFSRGEDAETLLVTASDDTEDEGTIITFIYSKQ